ncbi:MAG: hypothetical protein QXX19_08710, partial [Candidatus Caldarchaeum sp.]
AILFADASKLWNYDYRPRLPTLTEARVLAEEFIHKNALVPRGGQLIRQGAWVRYAKQGEQEIENHWELAYTLFHITTGFSKDGIPETEDLGALTVELGDNGEVIGLQRELGHELGPQELKPYLDYKQAQDWLRWKAFQRCHEDCPLLFLTLARSNFVLQGAYNLGYTLIVPGFLGWGEGREGEALWYHIPQTSFAVLARIVAPQHRAQFSSGAPIGFRAEVAQGFGTPPYQFLWYSNRDGLLSQASTFSKALSPGRHVITLWVSDRNGTVDTHTVIIYVGTSAPWPGAVGLVSSLALILGQWRKRWALMALLGGWLLVTVTSGASGISLQQPQPLTEGYYAFWPDASPQGGNKPVVGSKLTFRLGLSGDNGPEVEDLRWTPSGRNAILWLGRFLVPYIEITPQGQAPIKLEIPKPPKFSRLSVIQNPNCDPKRVPAQLQKGMWGLQDLGRALEAHYDLEVKDRWGKKLGTVNLVFDFRFYHPSWCRNSRVPEFYPEIRYTVQGFAVAKVRVPFLFKADIIDSQNDVAMMVKDPLIDVIQQGETNIACNVGARTVRPDPKPGPGGEVVCLTHEFMEVNFDGYYQGDVTVNVPACSMQTCFIFRVLKPALGQKFIAVLANPNEDEPQKLRPPKEPEDLIRPIAEPFNNKKNDIEFWYIAESDKPQDAFAADLPMWPVHFIGLSCASSQPGAGQSLFEPQACE